ncbi:MAG: hypothetical protein BM564_06725 [Bacteroidetes bacterium MedPE-SWsnd-G2]|nr:MAG: hypothetical protein BM564_06725 [Bacteroidetes bacterium MedPE-SWsnd-G2]
MKTTTLFLTIVLFSINNFQAQIGVGTTNPKSAFDISVANPDAPEFNDGLLVPRINNFPTENPTDEQDGLLVYLTTTNSFYFWNAALDIWTPVIQESTSENTHHIGEFYGGGIVFYTYDNGNHGLIISTEDMSDGDEVEWGFKDDDISEAESEWNGSGNTLALVEEGVESDEAAGLCNNYNSGNFSDWYLPSLNELQLIFKSLYIINKTLDSDSDSNTYGLSVNDSYWSSTQQNDEKSYLLKLDHMKAEKKKKDEDHKVRAIRAF